MPVLVTEPGLRVNVHVPLEGKPLNATLPVAVAHVGCVIVLTAGALGVDGAELITTSPLANDTQPASFVTVNVWVPETNPDTVVVAPVPVLVTEPGLRVNVHVPLDGKPLNSTLPVANAQVGCVSVPTVGWAGAEGTAFTVNAKLVDIQPVVVFFAVTL